MVRIALIGCGGISRRHIQWLLEREDCEIPLLCDIVRAHAEEKREAVRSVRPGADPEIVEDYHRVLERDDIDGAAVLLPHDLHFPVSRDVLAAGKHVLVEKPMVIGVQEAEKLAASVAASGCVLGIGYQRSYLPEYLYVQRMTEDGAFGTVRFLTVHLEQYWLRHALANKGEGTWRSDPQRAGGGQLMDTGSHTIAAMLQVTGFAPQEVMAWTDHAGLDVEVNTSLLVRFQEGAQAAITIGGFGHKVTESLRIVGDKASARIFFRTVKEQSLEVDGLPVDAKAEIARSNPDANFVEAITGEATVGADVNLGLRVARLTQAAYRSARSGQVARVDTTV